MKDRVDKSRGIVTLMTETLSEIKPTEPLRLVKPTARRNETDQIPWTILRPKHYPHGEHVRKSNTKSHCISDHDNRYVFTSTGLNEIG